MQDKAGIKIGPFGSQLKKCDLVSNGIHVLGIENVLSGKFDELGERYISQEKFQTLESVEVVPGDLLLTMMGTIGKVAVVPPSIRRSIMDSHLLRMRPDQRVIRTDYLAWAIQGSTAVLDAIEAQAHGAIMKGLNSAIVRSLPVPVPPLAEQQQIVGKLEEAFDGLAIATANAERNLRNARALFESHLESVFTRRGDSPVVPIGDVAEVFDGPHATPKTVDAGPVFLGISALQDGKINLGETRHVTLQDFRQWTRRVKPQSDDVVFSYETRLGQAAIIPEGLECCLGRRMGLVRVNRKRVDPRFFVYQYISPPFRKFVDSKTVRGATVDRIALKEFPSFPISLPSLSEQERMTNRLDKLRAETQRLESICRQKLAALGELKKSLLHQAFSGQL
ncbi:MAG: restriction endonuclease subunit S [Nitrospira sp.]|uniref:restriction endonuclease subunit S n=1 Tax=Nitrospira sp. ND1 TaxID=1658518 RepID=UPI00135653E2|nr:restriction endonuclease subunit S [Nitrospira sp. ND1]MBK7420704.1 restriction endonuclease subunit S [Nitrospira sp.]